MKTTPVRWTQAGHQSRASDQGQMQDAGRIRTTRLSSSLVAINAIVV